ncbi:hypothetical protein JCM19239_6778 [Vibrio variabilis]|uniref:Uncharacterized protein n=1 Tax=Vibrio variabilis TaxID=990271 RepID=A0ABQ0JH21_9VIBR|nr:hypothetical protein JCM19239_6778 [Vibrio variabilis]
MGKRKIGLVQLVNEIMYHNENKINYQLHYQLHQIMIIPVLV